MSSENFNEILINEINVIRTDPYEYCNKLNKITKHVVHNNNSSNTPNKFYFKYPNCKKIYLPSGILAFYNIIEILKYISPMKKLKWNEEILIDLSKFEYITPDLLRKIISTKKKELKKIYSNFHVNIDIIPVPQLSVIFQLIDDNEFNGIRRNIIISPNISYICASHSHNKITNKHFTVISFA